MKPEPLPRFKIRRPTPKPIHRDRCRRALHRAIVLAGAQEELAFALGVATSNVTRWKTIGEVPPHHALAIEVYTDGLIRAGLLCPRLDRSLRPTKVRVSRDTPARRPAE